MTKAKLLEQLSKKSKTELENMLARKSAEDIIKKQEDAFVKAVLEYPDGCADGKEDFLEYCGLPIPDPPRFDVTFSVEGKTSLDSEILGNAILDIFRDDDIKMWLEDVLGRNTIVYVNSVMVKDV